MTEKTPAELQAQRAQLIASTGLTEEVLRERAEAFQLYPEHMDVWRTVEGIDYLLGRAGKDAALPKDDDPDMLRERLAAAEETLQTLAPMFEGLVRLLSTSSRDWGEYRVDAWLWAVLCGWDCEQETHDETCVHGALEEMQRLHGWDDAAVAKARRYRAAVRAVETLNEDAG
ncbi:MULTISPECIES: hypothetical protein [unclassified Streptomyces]|uniref:hypothetical protein n=1 Tax=unclassified Streptomyces TaxID=2593676 RepID=UPI00080568D8|nr:MULTISPECIES: hypothetical protein [unclassified Streptomyces]MYR75102.1 hypothetical protein [Streptomyces sp. SID4925]SBU97935.1 hypothetical protein YUMDRAFT_05972 [Streptomyces sp. OspMP-M45]